MYAPNISPLSKNEILLSLQTDFCLGWLFSLFVMTNKNTNA